MKWYAYPIAITAYCIFVAMLVVAIINGWTLSSFWLWAGIAAVAFLAIAFVLTKLNWTDEAKVATQIAFILCPLVIMVNDKSDDKVQPHLFVVPEGYHGKLNITFISAKEQSQRYADTAWLVFDSLGRTAVPYDYRSVMDDMGKHLYYGKPGGKLIPIATAKINALPSDTTKPVAVFIESEFIGGRMKHLFYELNFPQKVSGKK